MYYFGIICEKEEMNIVLFVYYYVLTLYYV